MMKKPDSRDSVVGLISNGFVLPDALQDRSFWIDMVFPIFTALALLVGT